MKDSNSHLLNFQTTNKNKLLYMENKLYRWVKASERPMPKTINNKKWSILYKDVPAIIVFINDKWYWETELSPTAYPVHQDSWSAIYWLEPLPEINQEEAIKELVDTIINSPDYPAMIYNTKSKYILIKRNNIVQ